MTDVVWPDVLGALQRHGDLDEQTAAAVMRTIMGGEASPAQIAAFLIALRAKGETVDEVVGLARVMREFSLHVAVGGDLLDTCGTGGDQAGTVNISTMAALVAAGAGARVAKHGNRAASSACGSADVLEALDVVIDLPPEAVATCIEEAGIGFCFAPLFHPAMRFAGPVRRELGVPTVFNILGPLTNPADAQHQTVGVSDARLAPIVAEALARLGAQRAMVFRSADGLDELSVTADAQTWTVSGGSVTPGSLDPTTLGIPRAPADALTGGDAAHNARVVVAILSGEQTPIRDAVLLNAGAAIVVAGLAGDMAAGIAAAAESIDSGAASRALDGFRSVSQRLKG